MAVPDYGMLSWRINSFLRYPDAAHARPSQLAALGFYWTGQGEEVTCYGCQEGHDNFEMGQSIRREHMLRSPACPLNVGGEALQADDAIAVANFVPQDLLPFRFPREDLPMENDGLIRYFSVELQEQIVLDRDDPSESGYRWLRYENSGLLRRLTFHDWPEQNGDWEQLALRGLFYTGTGDTVRCCVCGATYRARLLQDHPRARRASCPLSSCWTYVF